MPQEIIAPITGVTGRGSTCLAGLLLNRGYAVHDIKRSNSLFNIDRIEHLYQDHHVAGRTFILHRDDMTDSTSLAGIIQAVLSDETYNLAAQSHVAVSFEEPTYTANEDALRDWGHAKNYVEMQWPMLQQEQAEDSVIATGALYSVRQFIHKTAAQLGITVAFKGQGAQEQAVVQAITGGHAPALKVGDAIVKVDPRYFRPTEVETLLGDSAKAKAELGWVPEITLDEMVAEMVAYDLAHAQQNALLKQHGYTVNVSQE